MRRGTFLAVLSSALVTGMYLPVVTSLTAAEAPRSWLGTPVVGHARIAPLDRLQRDFAFLAEGVDDNSKTNIRELLSELAEAVDGRRPAGAALLFDETFIPMLFIPVKDEQKLWETLAARFDWRFQRQSDGSFRYRAGNSEIDLVARVSGRWIYMTGYSHRDRLRRLPPDPTFLFAGTDPTLTAHVAVNIDQLPRESRAALVSRLCEAYSESDNAAVSNAMSLAEKWLRQLLSETKSLQLELQCFRPLDQFHVTTRLTAVEGSPLAWWIDEAAGRPTLFSSLPSRNAILAMIASLKLNQEAMRPLLEAWEPLAKKAQAAVPSPRSRNQIEARLGQLVAQAVDSVTRTLTRGELDAGIVVEPQGREQVVLLTGTTLQGARALDQAASDVAGVLQQVPDFRAMEWRVASNGDVSLNQLTVPGGDANTQALFGNPLYLAIGFGAERFFAALGGDETLATLSASVDRMRDDAPQRGEVFRIVARMAPLLATLDAIPGEDSQGARDIHEYARQIARFPKNDTLALTVTTADHTLEGRLQIDMGIVHMLASNLPIEQPPVAAPVPTTVPDALQPGTLQLRTYPKTSAKTVLAELSEGFRIGS